MITKFIRGETVRLISNTAKSHNNIGDIGIISEIDIDNTTTRIWYKIDVLGGPSNHNWSFSEDLIRIPKLNNNILIL